MFVCSMSQGILVVILICLILVLIMLLGSVGATAISVNTPLVSTAIDVNTPLESIRIGERLPGPMALSDHYPEPTGVIDDGVGVVAISDLPAAAQESAQLDWVKDGGKTIVDLGATCGEIKVFDPTKLYPGKSSDQYANYCNSMHSNRECQDRTCSVPLIMYACRDGCTDGLQASQRRAQIGKGAERITYQEYRAWKDGTPYPGSGESTWEEHCAWKDSLGFEGLGAGAEPCSQNYNMHENF